MGFVFLLKTLALVSTKLLLVDSFDLLIMHLIVSTSPFKFNNIDFISFIPKRKSEAIIFI